MAKNGDANDPEIRSLSKLSGALRGNAQPEALLALARQGITSKDLKLAEQAYKALLDRFPGHQALLAAKVELGWVYFNSGEPKGIDKAEALWRQVVAQAQPGTDVWGDAMWHLVQALAGPKFKWQEASELCAKIAPRYPSGSSRHEQAVFFRAWLFWAHKKWPEAKAAFGDFINAYPKAALHPPIMEYLADIDGALANVK